MGAWVSKKQAPQTWPTAQIINGTNKCVIRQQNGESLDYDTTTDRNKLAQINLYNKHKSLIARATYDTNIWHPGGPPLKMQITEDNHTCQLEQKDGIVLQYTIINKPTVVPNLIFLNANKKKMAMGVYIALPPAGVAESAFDCSCDEQVNDSRLYDNVCAGIDIYEQILTEKLKTVVNLYGRFPRFILDNEMTTKMTTILNNSELFRDSAILCSHFTWCELMMLLCLRSGLLHAHNSVNHKYNMIYNFERSMLVYQNIEAHDLQEIQERRGMHILDAVVEAVRDLLIDKQQKSRWNALWECKNDNMSLRSCIRVAEYLLSDRSSIHGSVGAYVITNALQQQSTSFKPVF